MSATSEELAAQAEQLQSSIAYFRTDDQARGAAPARASFRPAAPSRPAAVVAKPAAAAAKANGHANGHLNGQAKVPARKAANGRGFALDMTSGGADARDAEFERV
jgi:methyl-accepting chemotaxis protein